MQTISIKEAQQLAKEAGFNVTLVTIYNWVRIYKLGKTVGGKKDKLYTWAVYEEKFKKHVGWEKDKDYESY